LAKTRDGEPETIAGLPAMPPGLTPTQIEIWDHYTALLSPVGCIGQQDGLTLYRLVIAADVYVRNATKLAEEDDMIQPEDGRKRMYKNPRMSLLLEWAAELTKLERAFGLSPASRAGLSIEKPPEIMGKIT